MCLWCMSPAMCRCDNFIAAKAIARVYPVYLINVEQRQAAADSSPSQTT